MRPLTGIRVLDLSRLLPGPFLTSVLADLGADVVKVEPPGGDETRWIPPEVDGAGFAFQAVNRGKRSIVVDLKRAEGAEVVLRLAERCDVFVESFRPGVLDRLGLSDATLAARNPRLVRCSLVGYPPGPYRDDVGHDLNYQALAGILGGDDAPRPPPTQTADLGGALYAATGILAALLARERTGEGARIEVALADAARAMNVLPLARVQALEAAQGGWELGGAAPCYRIYRCADGRHVALGALEPKFWDRACAAAGLDPALQFDAGPDAHARVEAVFATKSAAAWVDALRSVGVPITPVLAPDEVDGPTGAASPLTRATSSDAAPNLGEHAEALLRDAGYSDQDVQRLREGGVLGDV